jgi:hypothetical protein
VSFLQNSCSENLSYKSNLSTAKIHNSTTKQGLKNSSILFICKKWLQTSRHAQATHGACVCLLVARRAEGMAGNDGTDATPRSRAFALGFAGSCRAVLCLQPFFQNIIMNPIENVPCANFDRDFQPFSLLAKAQKNLLQS